MLRFLKQRLTFQLCAKRIEWSTRAHAIELATSPEKFVSIKRKLADSRLTTPLFNTQSFTRDIERAYMAIYGRYQRGLPPEHTYVAQ